MSLGNMYEELHQSLVRKCMTCSKCPQRSRKSCSKNMRDIRNRYLRRLSRKSSVRTDACEEVHDHLRRLRLSSAAKVVEKVMQSASRELGRRSGGVGGGVFRLILASSLG